MWLFKGLFRLIGVTIFLALIFLSTYAVFSTIIPAMQSGEKIFDILKEMTNYIYACIRSLIG